MPNLTPEGEKVRRAVRWIVDHRKEGGGPSLASLIDQATLRFDLSPKEAELVIDFYRKATSEG